MGTAHDLTVTWDTPEPVYEQIARQIRERVVSGDLRPGEPLPAVRTLASDLGVNLNTVARAYRLLEEQGFALIRHRSGAEIAAPAAYADAATRARLAAELRDVLHRMRQAGLAAGTIRQVVEASLEEGGDSPRGGRETSP